MPFSVARLAFQCSPSDFKETHRHSRADFRELDALVTSSYEHMVANLDAVFNVFESHDPVAHFLI